MSSTLDIRKHKVCTYKDKRALTASELKATAVDRTYSLCFASEFPVKRPYGYEVLVCDKDNVVLDRLQSKANVLFNHDPNQVIGVVETVSVDADRKCRATVKISANRDDIITDINDGVLTQVSFGYEVVKLLKVEERNGEKYYFWKFSPYEISMVSIPADYKNAGLGRSKTNIKSNSKGLDKKTEKPLDVQVNSNNNRREYMTDDVKEIMKLAKENNALDLAAKAIEDGVDINGFRSLLLNKITKDSAKKAEVVETMEKKAGKRYSFARAAMSLMPNSRVDASFEYEVSNELAKLNGVEAKGIYVPASVLKRTSTTTTTVNDFIAQEIGETIEVLRNELVAGKLGVTMIKANGSGLKLPKPDGANAYWVGEGTDYTESVITTDGVEIACKQVGGYLDVTKMALSQAAMSVSLEQMLLDDLTKAIYSKVDTAIITGSGAASIPGVANMAIHTITVTAGAPTLAQLIGFEQKLLESNVNTDGGKWLIAPDVYALLVGTQAYAGGGSGLLDLASQTVAGRPYVVSNTCPQGQMIFGKWDNLILATFSDLDITVDTSALGKQQGLRLIGGMLVGSGVKRVEAFAIGRAVADLDESSSSS